jgi:hypothetical protein
MGFESGTSLLRSGLAVLRWHLIEESLKRSVVTDIRGVGGEAENFCDLGARERVPVNQSKDLLIDVGESTKRVDDLRPVDVATCGRR